MILATWFGASSRRLPWQPGGAARLLICAVALMAYVAALGAVGLRIVARSEARWQRAAGVMTLEVPAEASPARLKTALALLRQTRGIAAVRLLTQAQTARLLRPWLGPGAQLDGLPLPRLIDLHANPAAAIDFAALREHLAAVVPGGKLDANGRRLDAMRGAARRLRIVLGACLAAGLAAIAPAAVFAAASAANADRALIEAAHLLGAADRDLIRPLALRALRMGLVGGAVGALAAAATLAALGPAAVLAQPPLPVGEALADWRNWAILAAVALVAGLIAAVATAAGLRRRLLHMP
jgi:cell division transport system permease protein